jgi:hypothetical protein
MSNNDQQLVDHLFEQIFVQRLRCTHFNTINPSLSSKSIWNKSSDEKAILELVISKYKKYYQDKIEYLKTLLVDKKEIDVSSYLTYDTDYYINEYNDRNENINKYLVELENKTLEQLTKEDLTIVSNDLTALYPNFMSKPSLLGLL